MADFTTRKKFTTKLPQLNVVAGLPVGKYVFQLQATDESGNVSLQAKLVLEITPVILGPLTPITRDDLILSPVITSPTLIRPIN